MKRCVISSKCRLRVEEYKDGQQDYARSVLTLWVLREIYNAIGFFPNLQVMRWNLLLLTSLSPPVLGPCPSTSINMQDDRRFPQNSLFSFAKPVSHPVANAYLLQISHPALPCGPSRSLSSSQHSSRMPSMLTPYRPSLLFSPTLKRPSSFPG